MEKILVKHINQGNWEEPTDITNPNYGKHDLGGYGHYGWLICTHNKKILYLSIMSDINDTDVDFKDVTNEFIFV